MQNEHTFEIRDLRNGDWYWIHRAVINEYTKKVGAVGIIVYSFLASLTDNRQRCFPSQKYIADKLGYCRATVNRAMKRLEENGLVMVEKRSRYHCVYHLLKVRCNSGETQMSHRRNSELRQSYTNDTKRSRKINNIDNKRFKDFKPRTKEELLAFDLASALDDINGLALYISYARRYPESILRRLLSEVKEIPQEKIRKSRAALFNHLVCEYAQTNKNHRD